MAMDPNAVVFQFGAISSATVALVFAYKWASDGRRDYDLFWACGHGAFAIAIALAAVYYAFQSDLAGMIGVIVFWFYAGVMIAANLAFTGELRRVKLLVGGCVLVALVSIAFGLYRIEVGLAVFAPIAAAITVWTGWLLRDLPRIGRVAFVIFTLRGITALTRPYFAISPFLLEFSSVSLTLSFLCGATLLAGSVLRSRDDFIASKNELRKVNASLVAREVELRETNRLLEEQAVRLERLGYDYAAALGRAEQANRAKDSFISNMNHEFRTPLNAVLGFSELIQAESARKQDAQIREYADYVHQGGRDMLRNVDRILEFVALDTGEREARTAPFDPREAILSEIKALAEMAQAKNLVIASLLDEAPAVWPGDEHAFRSIADELLRNALKAAPEASTVTIRVAGEDDELLLQITDHGKGLSDDFLRTIGERFNISEHVLHRGGDAQGVGLGLCIAARYATLMGGALRLDRNQPTGTVARVVLSAA